MYGIALTSVCQATLRTVALPNVRRDAKRLGGEKLKKVVKKGKSGRLCLARWIDNRCDVDNRPSKRGG